MPLSDRFPLTFDTLFGRARAIGLWIGAAAAVVALYTASYAALGLDDPETSQAFDALPDDVSAALSFNDLSSGAGYLQGTVFGLLGPIILIALAGTLSARLLAGDEEDGILDVLLSTPVERGRLVIERMATVSIVMVAMWLVLSLEVLLLTAILDMGVPAADVLAATLGIALIGLLFGAVSFALGGITGRRTVALAGAAGLAVLSYMLSVVPSQIDAIEFLQRVSPFYWGAGSSPIREGFDALNVLLLVAVTIALAGASVIAFRRRDLAV